MKRVTFVLVLLFFSFGSARAEDPVYFPDPKLKAAVETDLWIPNPTPTDMLGLTTLRSRGSGISDLTGLECAKNLQTLILRENNISDLWPISGLVNLDTLDLSMNKIGDISDLSALVNLTSLDVHDNHGVSDISAVSGMTKLRSLVLRHNSISDISPLSGLSNLSELDLFENNISDISPLVGLKYLSYLDIQSNPLDEEACDVHIPQILADNPGIHFRHDRCGPVWLSLSSTVGGSVIEPGEGEFECKNGTVVWLQAEADPCFAFVNWTGNITGAANPFMLLISGDHQIRANFLSLRDALYVDLAASHDPGPADPASSDPNEDGTAGHPFDSIQEALEVAGEGATVFVAAGTYRENIEFPRRSVRLIGMDPNDPTRQSWPVIQGVKNEPVVRFSYSPRSKCLLRGFVITHGRGQPAGAIHCDGTSPTITHCLIVGNRATGANGAAVYCRDSKAVLTNCTIADNYAGPNGAGLTLIDSDVTVLDSILWDNLPEEIRVNDTSVPDIRYCAVRGWWPDFGNIHKNPLLARAGSWVNPDNPREILGSADPRAVWVEGDYHLKSQAGRWDPQTQSWVQDEVTSPAIDAGLSISPVGQEPAPNGGRVNMGVYGGTAEASKSKL